MKKISLLIICSLGVIFGFSQIPPSIGGAGASNALAFSETNDSHVLTSANNALDSDNQGTFECWVKLGTLNTRNGLFGYSTHASNISFFLIAVNSSNVLAISYKMRNTCSASSTQGAGHTGTTVFQANTWYHIAVVSDGVNPIKAYINGVPESLTFTKGSSDALGSEWMSDVTCISSYDHHISIGSVETDLADPTGSSLNGEMDEVRIWNVLRTQTEIKDNMCKTLVGNEPNLVGYWPMTDMGSTCGGSTQVCDKTGNGNDGVLN